MKPNNLTTQRKAQFFIITTVLISGALLFITSMFASTANIDYTDVLSRHDTDIVKNTVEKVQETWWDTEWRYRTSITLREMSGEYAINQSVPVTLPIQPVHINKDCSDIRVVTDGSTAPWMPTTSCDVETYDSKTTAVARFKMDEEIGQWANDSTGNGHNGEFGGDAGTVQSSDPSWMSGRYGFGLEFDGTEDYVQVKNDTRFNGGSSAVLSVGAWFYTPGPSESDSIVSKQWDLTDGDWELTLREGCPAIASCTGSPPYIGFYSEAGSRGGQSDYMPLYGPVSTNEWHHAMFVLDQPNETLDIYLDGTRVLQDTNIGEVSANTAGDVFIGAQYYRNTDPQHFFEGRIDDVRIYDKILSPEHIQGIYENGVGVNISASLGPGETETVHVYHGNVFADHPNHPPALLQSNTVSPPPEVVSIDPLRSQTEAFQNLDAAVERTNEHIAPSIDFERDRKCVRIVFQSSLTNLRKEIC